MGTFTVIAMMAQLFLGKIAFLAGAALLLSKISLLFSIVVWLLFLWYFCCFKHFYCIRTAYLKMFFCFIFGQIDVLNRTRWKSKASLLVAEIKAMALFMEIQDMADTKGASSSRRWIGFSPNNRPTQFHRYRCERETRRNEINFENGLKKRRT